MVKAIRSVAVVLALIGALSSTASADEGDPVVSITAKPSDPSLSNGATFEFSSSPQSATFECSLDGAQPEQCESPKQLDKLADGRHTFTVTATDGVGKSGSASYSWSVNAIALSGPPPLSASRDASLAFTMRRATFPSPTFECALDQNPRSPCSSPKPYAGLADGTHTFRVWALQGTQEIGRDEYSWTVDATQPKLAIRSGPAAETSESVSRFEFDVDDPRAKVECAVDSEAPAPCSSPYVTLALASGQHTFVVQATDAAGNVARVVYSWTITLTITTLDTTAPAAATFLDFFVGYGRAQVLWIPPEDDDFDHVTLFESQGGGRRVAAYSGTSASFTEKKFNNGVDHRYRIVAYDHAGNASPAATVTIPSSALLATPRRGARVLRAPALRWAAVATAAFYNVQVFRNGRKIASTWPRLPRVQLASRWHYAKRTYSLTRGTYEWWVWPAFRRGTAVRYGAPLGHSSFVKR